MSFSSGTVIGEISLMLPMNSTSAIRCASVCELHTLSLPALYKVLEVFPEKIAVYRSVINRRLQTAEDLFEDMKIAQRETNDTIIWLKKKWTELSTIHMQKKVLIKQVKPTRCFLFYFRGGKEHRKSWDL